MAPEDISVGDDGVARCFWADSAPEYRPYHDTEWGFPVADDVRLFEKLSLEGFQAGLSWLTILRKREAFRAAFAGFDFAAGGPFGERDVARLLGDAGIVRHRGKIEAVINNAQRAVELVAAEGSLATTSGASSRAAPRAGWTAPLWPSLRSPRTPRRWPRTSSGAGWRFVGPTTVYAFMQAMGLVNDHLDGCDAQAPAAEARRAFTRP